jgi:hypothetical protein
MLLQVGIQHKPDDLNMKTANLVEVNVMKDQVCNDILKITWSTRKMESFGSLLTIY